MKTFNLIAKQGREFSITNGWNFNEETTTSKEFDTEEEVRNFFKELEYATIENSVVKNIFEETEEE